MQFTNLTKAICAFALMAVAGPGTAQDTSEDIPEMPPHCSVQDAGEIIQIVVCDPSDVEQKTLIEAGRAACGLALPCGAWVWTDADKAPLKAPANHDGLTQDQITASKGVWVAEQKSFIFIDEAN